MAEPASNYNEDLIPDENQKPETQPYLKAVPGTGVSDGVKRGNLHAIPDSESETLTPEQLANQEVAQSRTTSAGNKLMALPGGLQAAEAAAGSFNFNPNDKSDRGNFRAALRIARSRKALLGGAGGIVAILIGVGMFFILPGEIISYMSGVENHFFAPTNRMVEKESQQLVNLYIRDRNFKETWIAVQKLL